MPEPTETVATLPFRAGIEARDLAAVVDAFAPDAVVHSPITGALTFAGHEQIRAVFGVILDVFKDIRYTDELRGEGSAALVASAQVDGTDIELVDHMRLDEDGRISELTVFFRPLPAIAVSARAIGAGLGVRSSRSRARVISALVGPLIPLTRVGDRIGARLIGPTL
jgi:SnoaL-like domain